MNNNNESRDVGYIKAFIQAPWGVELVSILLIATLCSQIIDLLLEFKVISCPSICLHLGILLGILKRKNWARLCMIFLMAIVFLVGLINAINHYSKGDDPWIFGAALLFLIPVLVVGPLYLPSSNRWFKPNLD